MRHLGDASMEPGSESRGAVRRPGAVLPDRLSTDDLAGQLGSRVIGGPFLYHEEVASTNAEARSLAIDGASEGTVVVAESQTAGRGRLGRRWLSPAGQGLLFSVVLRPPLPMSEVHLMTLVVACAAARAIESMTGVTIDVKWPNDLFSSDRKVGGILMEIGGTQDVVDWVVVGIGINVNTNLSELPATVSRTAGSIKSVSGAAVDRSELLARVLLHLDVEYTAALTLGFARALDGFRDRDYLLGRDISVQTKDGLVSGRAAGINEYGALIVKLSKERVRCFYSGDVTLRVQPFSRETD
jgi:BirA family transcriptional regulator, biotin operon repressor / biotin---[acetyl-CoA-carboxylase] ligase